MALVGTGFEVAFQAGSGSAWWLLIREEFASGEEPGVGGVGRGEEYFF